MPEGDLIRPSTDHFGLGYFRSSVAGALIAPQQPKDEPLRQSLRSLVHRQSFRWMSQDQCLSSSKERLVLNSPCPFTTLESAIGTGRG